MNLIKKAYYMIKNSGISSWVATFEFKTKDKLIILNQSTENQNTDNTIKNRDY